MDYLGLLQPETADYPYSSTAEESVDNPLWTIPEEFLAEDDEKAPPGKSQWANEQSFLHPNSCPSFKRARLSQPYFCEICGTSYGERRTLLRHLRSPAHCRRAGEPFTAFECRTCGRTFARNDFRLRPIREVHGDEKRSITSRRSVGERVSRDCASTRPCSVGPDLAFERGEPSSVSLVARLDHPSATWHPEDVLPNSHELDLPEDPLEEPTAELVPNENASIKTAPLSCILNGKTDNQVLTLSANTNVPALESVSFDIPYRSRLVPESLGQRNPRPLPPRNPQPCPLCNKEFGRTSQEVNDHMNRHLQELKAGERKFRCELCQIDFIHETDYKLHLHTTKSMGSCGFEFAHENCTGHHPPGDNIQTQSAHRKLTLRIHHWEESQNENFMAYVDAFAGGTARTNAPAYGAVYAFTRSTGSLITVCSDQTMITTRSHGTSRSAPIWLEYSSRSDTTWLRKSALRKLADSVHPNPSRLSEPLAQAIRRSDIQTARDLLSRGAKLEHIGGFRRQADIAFSRMDPEMLVLLYDISPRRHREPQPAHDDVYYEEHPWATSVYERDGTIALSSCIGISFQQHEREPRDVVENMDKSVLSEPRFLECVQTLLEKDVYVDGQALVFAVGARLSEFQTLVLKYASSKTGIPDLLLAAVLSSSEELVRALLVLEIKPRYLREALFASHVESSKIQGLLLEACCDTMLAWEFLVKAMQSGDLGMIETALRCYTSDLSMIDHQDVQARSALHHAARHNFPEVADVLIKHGASLDLLDKEGQTPLIAASLCGNTDVHSILVQGGAVRDRAGTNALLYACDNNDDELMCRLLTSGARCVHTNSSHDCVFYRAVERGLRTIVETIVRYEPHYELWDWALTRATNMGWYFI